MTWKAAAAPPVTGKNSAAKYFKCVSSCSYRLEYKGTSLIRNTSLLGPYSRTIPRIIWWSWGGGCFL